MDEHKNEKVGRGGPRPGSGRPRSKKVRMHLSIEPLAHRLLKAHAFKLRVAPGAIVIGVQQRMALFAAMRTPTYGDYPFAVVGSIVLRISVIFVAGKPLISACLRMMPSSLAR